MASNIPKTKLAAICKLEFYRKQTNWQYCPPERKGKDPKRRTKTTNTKGSKEKLNQTYNIARAPEAPEGSEASEKQETSNLDIQETEERHILDEAFVDTESDEAVQREDEEMNVFKDVAEAAAVGAGGEEDVDGDWQLHDLSDDVSVCSSVPSAASSAFIRGAALAPHSTQIDLLVGVVGAEPAPASLPAGALAAAVARHSAALCALLAEAQRRDQMPSEPPSSLYSFAEVPERDPGPALLPAATVFNDRIVARSRPTPALRGHVGSVGHIGSAGHSETGAGHRGSVGQAEVGRGRGRLNVGIRMGRPYWL